MIIVDGLLISAEGLTVFCLCIHTVLTASSGLVAIRLVMAHDLATHAFTPEAPIDVSAPVYVVRDSDDVGIGNRIFFSTEKHPKKLSDTVGVLTLHATQ